MKISKRKSTILYHHFGFCFHLNFHVTKKVQTRYISIKSTFAANRVLNRNITKKAPNLRHWPPKSSSWFASKQQICLVSKYFRVQFGHLHGNYRNVFRRHEQKKVFDTYIYPAHGHSGFTAKLHYCFYRALAADWHTDTQNTHTPFSFFLFRVKIEEEQEKIDLIWIARSVYVLKSKYFKRNARGRARLHPQTTNDKKAATEWPLGASGAHHCIVRCSNWYRLRIRFLAKFPHTLFAHTCFPFHFKMKRRAITILFSFEINLPPSVYSLQTQSTERKEKLRELKPPRKTIYSE